MLLIILLGLASCTTKDENYYRAHPKELSSAVEHCADKKSNILTCQQLERLAMSMSQLAYQLQSDPQGFGLKIISLQQQIVEAQEQAKKSGSDLQAEKKLEATQHQLVEMLSVVKWLESPEG